MSSKKIATDEKWDRNNGRFTLYFSQTDLPRLLELAEAEGLDGAALVKFVFKQFMDGKLVRKEALDSYKYIIEQLLERQQGIPEYGTKEQPEKGQKESVG